MSPTASRSEVLWLEEECRSTGLRPFADLLRIREYRRGGESGLSRRQLRGGAFAGADRGQQTQVSKGN